MTLIYTGTKLQLSKDIFTIDDIIEKKFLDVVGRRVPANEKLSWRNSLMYMDKILSDRDIPDDCGIAIEYHIPQTSKRIDFIITGRGEDNREYVIIIELKQWSEAEITTKDGLVLTRFQHGLKETPHPSYQAWSYAALLQGYNMTVYTEDIQLRPCAYLHNYKHDDGVLRNEFYKEHLEKAPVFLEHDHDKLQEFIKKYIKQGDKTQTMYRIEKGEIRPSKQLADSLTGMLKDKEEFVMIDEQKVIFENVIEISKLSSPEHKNVIIVEGGPGTGKSVVAINLLVALGKTSLVKYVTKNAAPRTVYESKLTGTLNKTQFANLFSGSGSFTECPPNMYGTLVIDEAHRLNEKSGLFKNKGENQIKELIRSAKCTVFFIDENQKVTLHDIGEIDEIIKRARHYNAKIHKFELSSQFRCNGSDGYLAWLDNTLQIRETANTTLDDSNYEFKVVSSPNELRDMIYEKNKINNKARIVAGYCRDWVSKKNRLAYDIVIPEHDFGMRWNLATDGNLWILKPESVTEVGCIHTCQGLEMDYVGVIVGNDFVIRNGKVVTQPQFRAKTDASIKGYKNYIKKFGIDGEIFIDAIIKNTYRTLMTRGMKGCYVYFTDKETEEWFRKNI